jgi:molybdate transport system ATP-binding protein
MTQRDTREGMPETEGALHEAQVPVPKHATVPPARVVARFDLQRAAFRLRAAFEVPATGVIAAFGPSGAGKTTLLRCIAGLERAPGGFLQVGADVWQDESRGRFVPVERRGVGYVFQEPRLFPHLDVRRNLEYGWKRTPPGERRIGLGRVVDAMDLGALLHRRPAALSGGEAQRVAIGRALLANPRLLLLDEPLASLDVGRKREILPFVGRLRAEFDIPILYVTHAVGEILQLADTVLLMVDGTIAAAGALPEVFARTDVRARLLAGAIGSVLDTTVVAQEPEYGLTRVEFSGHALEVPHRALEPGQRLRVHVLPRDVTLQARPPEAPTSALNVLPGTVVAIPESGPDDWSVEVQLDVGAPLAARITRKSLVALDLRVGQRVWAHVKAVALAEELAE